MKIEIGKRAQRQVERISDWWRENAEHPLLFEQELQGRLLQLSATPSIGVSYPTEKRPHLKRLLVVALEEGS